MTRIYFLISFLLAAFEVQAANEAGIGAEFEVAVGFFLESLGCSVLDTDAAKGKVVAGREHDFWYLSADTGHGEGKLAPEDILDGLQIKVGSGDARRYGEEVANDLASQATWHPWNAADTKRVDIADNNCNPWLVTGINGIDKPKGPDSIFWQPQITTSMPLEALYSLMKEQVEDKITGRSVLNGNTYRSGGGLRLVTPGFFQAKPNGIKASEIKDDALAFLTLVLSYAKSAIAMQKPDQSPKLFTSFMPRTEFVTMYTMVKDQLCGDLWELMDIIACYQVRGTTLDDLAIDNKYCSGSMTDPKPNEEFGKLTWTNEGGEPESVNIKEWIQGIGQESPVPDRLSAFDKGIDGSLGGFGSKTEMIWNSDREAPIFEFRDLRDKKSLEFGDLMGEVDGEIKRLHEEFAVAPHRVKRDTSCAASLPPKPPTVQPVDPPFTPKCAAAPTGKYKDAHEGMVQLASRGFCGQYAENKDAKTPIAIKKTFISKITPTGRGPNVPIAIEYQSSQGNQDDVFDFSITSVENCTPKGGKFDLDAPVATDKCEKLMFNAWKKCNNQGRGGEITAGCLTYGIKTKF